ncbi:MAG TPA: GNAT family N-acetyltransferase [Bryobacteraceae bacterium]|nr:GNAT family N-acetyltransferase [Bryobacteraceae bacterium]
MSLEIRVLQEADAEAFRKLRRQALDREPLAFGEAPEEHQAQPFEAFARRLAAARDDDFVLGAFVDGNLVGTAGFARIQRVKRRHKGIVWGMYVDAGHRGLGVGRALLEALLARVRELPDLQQIQLSVTASQSAARKLYESLGFVSYGREPAALYTGGEFIDEAHMALELKKPDR